MKNPVGNAERWFRQAEHDLGVVRLHLKARNYADACFMAEQTAQKCLKAYLYFRGERAPRIHAVHMLVEACGRYDPAFLKFHEAGALLDQYVLSTRYPDVLADPAVPFEMYTRGQAVEALRHAGRMLAFVRRKIRLRGPRPP